MTWHQRLFWRIFAAVWLVSMLGIVVSVSLFSALSDSDERGALQRERARINAEQVISDLERGEEPRLHHNRRLPIWIIDDNTGQTLFGDQRRPPKEALTIEIETANGREYRVLFPRAVDALLTERMFGFLLSFQALWLLVVSLLSSLLLTWLIVRPINALRAHVQSVHDNQNLAARADLKLSQRKDELGELAREIDRMAEHVEQTMSAQENQLRDVSHELRAPLARLQASAGLAEQRLGENDKLVLRINSECARLERLISELLQLSRQQLTLSKQEPVGLKRLLGELLDDARLLDPESKLSAQLSEIPDAVKVGAEPLSRIISNLLANAVKHAGAGANISLTARVSAKSLEVEVLDDGRGVSPELLAQLGQPFKRGGDSSGYGLGLSICQRAARQSGGEVRFANRPSGGFVARLELPLS